MLFLQTTSKVLGCARFPEFVHNFSERQILWSLCLVDFHAFTLQLVIQTLHSVAPELQVFVSSPNNCQNISKTSTPLSPIYLNTNRLHGNTFEFLYNCSKFATMGKRLTKDSNISAKKLSAMRIEPETSCVLPSCLPDWSNLALLVILLSLDVASKCKGRRVHKSKS